MWLAWDASQQVWSAEGDDCGKLIRTLSGHGHRINTLALSCEYVCRTGPFDHSGKRFADAEQAQSAALDRYNK